MTFKLEKVEANKDLVKFHIWNSADELVGSVNVQPKDESDLLRSWKGESATPAPKAAKPADRATRAKEAFVAALKKGPRLNKAALLRS